MSNKRVSSTDVSEELKEDRLDHERWEQALTEGVVLGQRCGDCEYVTATPSAACVRCGSRTLIVVELPETGTVYTKTTVEVAPGEQGHGYQIAFVDLGEARLLARIADGDRVDIGDKVELKSTREHAGDVAAVFGSAASS
jgi:uncharacterized OB-fold protein